jgi:protein-disulfide isomerase
MDSPEAFEAPSSGLSRRQVLATGSVVALSGCLGGGGDSNRSSGAQENEDVANAPVPDSPSSLTYGTMGGGDRPTVTYYGNWKCPYCAQFSASFLGDLVTDYVESGDINLQFRALSYINGKPFLGPDAPRAARAGLAVWNVDPETYWRYHEYVFANQPPESETWATTDKLVSFADSSGVGDPDRVREQLDGQTYETAVRKTSETAAAAGVSATPALVIDGETVNPLSDESRVRTLIDGLVDAA